MNLVDIPSGDLCLKAAYTAPTSPKAVVVLVHGMAEHKERYFPFMNYLAESGYAAVITDLRGHGETASSQEELGYFGKKGKEALIEDNHNVVLWAKEHFPGLKVFLFGHSMGSLIVRCVAKKYDGDLSGLIVCGSPSKVCVAGLGVALTHIIGLFKGQRYRSHLLAKMATGVYGKKFKAEGLTNAWLSSNKANVQAYNNDPLCGFRFTVNGYRALMQLMQETYADKGWAVQNPDMPVHFIAGSNDPCIGSIKAFSGAVSFFRGRGYSKVTSKVYPQMRHEILNETGREDVWRDVKELLENWA